MSQNGLGAMMLQARRETQQQQKVAPRWTPQSGPQRQAYECQADEVLYGGAAGGGKSMTMIALPLPWIDHPQLSCLFLRRTTPQLEELLKKSRWVYKTGLAGKFAGADPDAEFRGDKGIYTFKAGGQIRFGHCNDVDDWENYQGHEYVIVGFDELTQFTEQQYLEIKSRVRASVHGLPRRVFATSNPGGEGHEWVFKRWGPFLDPKFKLPDWEETVVNANGSISIVRGTGKPPRFNEDGQPLPPAEGSELLYVARIRDTDFFSMTPFEVDGVMAATRTFIPAKLDDNPALLDADPTYRGKLRDFDPVRRRQLEGGDWTARPSAGLYFRRAWVGEPVDSAPADCIWARSWDIASTEPHEGNKDPDWTRGVRVGKSRDGLYYVANIKSLRAGPGPVSKLIRDTAEYDGKEIVVTVPEDPGAAGKRAAAADVQLLTGFTVKTKSPTGKKTVRFGPVSTQASPDSTGGKLGRFRVVRGDWNEELFGELEGFPDGRHDDIADAISDAFDELQGMTFPEPLEDYATDGRYRFGNGRGFG